MSMRVLGVSCGLSSEYEDNEIPSFDAHDAAAALVEDSRVLAAIEEERLSRVKHSNFFPARAVDFCLRETGMAPEDLDAVAVSFSEVWADDFARRTYLADPASAAPTGRSLVADLFRRHTGLEVEERIRFASHHVAHAWSAFYPSPFTESLVVALDGVGEDGAGGFASGIVALGKGGCLDIHRTYPVEASLGLFYQRMIEVVGFGVFEEYKVMALASHGRPEAYRELISSMVELLPEGGLRLAAAPTRLARLEETGVLERARRRGAPIEPWHADFAAALQETLETAALHVLGFHRERTGCPNLCVAGGVGLNAVLNGRILGTGWFDAVLFFPAAHDAGTAVGAAWSVVAASRGRPAGTHLGSIAWGSPTPGDEDLGRTLERWAPFVMESRLEGDLDRVAELLAQGQLLGRVQGRSEFGPRALGNRSVLADPRSAALRDRVNRDVKGRESFRPLAPVVLLERAKDYFELPGSATSYAHMNVVVRVRPDRRAELAGVTHVDGTARLQTVAREDDADLWGLICSFGERTGTPVLLNTSLNRAGEPIVDSVEDALAFLLHTGLDGLVIGDWLVAKRPGLDFGAAVRSFRIDLAPHKKLVRRAGSLDPSGRPLRYGVESTARRFFDRVRIEVSRDAFEILLATGGGATLGDLLDRHAPLASSRSSLVAELVGLWRDRAIVLTPAAPAARPARVGL
ncbi:MAG: nodulation protein [Planctomycetes bacterium]|nr:nodulation protein [Planctomycetota bacterium]